MLWDSLRKDGYKRSYASLIRVVRKWVKPEIKKKQEKMDVFGVSTCNLQKMVV